MLALAIAIIVAWGLWAHCTLLASRALGARPAIFWLSVATGACYLLLAAGHALRWPQDLRLPGPSLGSLAGAALCAVGGYALFVIGQARFPASVFVPLTALYPAGAVLLAACFLGEAPGPREWLGLALACAAGALLAWGR